MTVLDPAPARLQVDIVVHGRFHGFALARALIAHGHDVLVHTNYPPFIVARFGVPPNQVRSLVMHGLTARALARSASLVPPQAVEPALHRWFGRWAARSVRPTADVVYGFTGIMEEYLRTPRPGKLQLRSIVRGSAHIRLQHRLLAEEARRAQSPIEMPSDWMVAREEREYALADEIFVLSDFARDSFVQEDPGLRDKLHLNALGVDARKFLGTPEDRERRRQRILSGKPLHVLNVGTFSYQKGMIDFVEVARRFGDRAQFSFVGAMPSETADLQKGAAKHIRLSGRVPETELPAVYREADIFLFPTIQDGFAAVLLQAASAGLPVIATTNCSAPDFIRDGVNGWVVPIRDPDAIADRLAWCDANREALAAMADGAGERAAVRDWNMMALEVVGAYGLARSRALAL